MDDLRLLPRAFYERDALAVAQDLVGARLRHGEVVIEIVETEAYRGPDDSASHARSGRTARNAPMWGPAGRAYVYLCYGLHEMLNVVCGRDGEAHAVLLRAGRLLAGDALVRARRGDRAPRTWLDGPGKLAAALGVDRGFNDAVFHEPGALEIHAGASPRLAAGPRVGIGFAKPRDVRAPWRFAAADSPHVSKGGALSVAAARRLRSLHPAFVAKGEDP